MKLQAKTKDGINSKHVFMDSIHVQKFGIENNYPTAVIEPESLDELTYWVKAAWKQRTRILTWGGGFRMYLGDYPGEFEITLCTKKLHNKIDFDPENLTITVEAGMTINNLFKLTSKKGFWLPLDGLISGDETIGGLIAANASGPRRSFYGSIRDLLLGIKAVKGDGIKIKAGGKTVKNVAGYDLSKLFVGSLGTLGIITEATLKLSAMPEINKTVIVAYEKLNDCIAAAEKLLHSRMMPCTLEILNANAASTYASALLHENQHAYILMAVFEGKKEMVDGVSRLAVNELKTLGSRTVAILDKKEQNELHSASYANAVNKDNMLSFKISVPILRLAEVLDYVATLENDTDIQTYTQYSNGIVYLVITYKENAVIDFDNYVGDLRQKIKIFGGSLVVEKAPYEFKKKVDIWGADENHITIMKKIKNEFDPAHIFIAGRFVGGI